MTKEELEKELREKAKSIVYKNTVTGYPFITEGVLIKVVAELLKEIKMTKEELESS